ncbi:hypothetical protein C8034_v002743 [Colletotrichum sidae]|uniref:Uncharacterized protein n=1 Tax=Colletotrichum sidae TaxID=1347389 RepID=A0A4R8TB41_9PEZI|nr:hypothetical protein C8034_v002743 [Colletotrichum sidae]
MLAPTLLTTISLFFTWLGDGNLGDKAGTTRKPKPSWVADVLLNEGSPRVFRLARPGRTPEDKKKTPNQIPLATPAQGETIDNIIAYGSARSDRVPADHRLTIDRTSKNFALVEEDTNKRKGTFFKLANPSALKPEDRKKNMPPTANESRQWIRTCAAVFQYLGYRDSAKPAKEPVWDKWMRVSNWVDLVLHEFDKDYPWGKYGDEEPLRDDGRHPSLRSLYAYWIDVYLSNIEDVAEDWATRAKAAFEKKAQL